MKTSLLCTTRAFRQQFGHVMQRYYMIQSKKWCKTILKIGNTHPSQCASLRYESAHTMQNPSPKRNEADDKRIGITISDQKQLIKKKPQQPLNPQILKVSIIGSPNAGKSTLANQLIGWRFASVSKKVHTTRHNAVGVLTHNNTQVVFLDTPGLITPEKVKRHNLERTLLTDPYSSLFEADMIITVVDVSQPWNRSKLDHEILAALMMHNDKKSILVLNKVDLLKCKSDLLTTARLLTEGVIDNKPAPHVKSIRNFKKKEKEADILQKILGKESHADAEKDSSHDKTAQSPTLVNTSISIDKYSDEDWWNKYMKKLKQIKCQAINKRGWEKFSRVFMTSAIDGDGVDDIKQYLIESAVPGPWLYHSAVVTDQDPIKLVKLCVREKILDHLPKEIPYQIEVKVKQWELDENNYLRGCIDLVCPRSRDLAYLLGKDGQNIAIIRKESQQELMNIFQQELSLYISAYVSPKSGRS